MSSDRPKYASGPTDIPKLRHYGVVKFSKIHIPGDERSRTHPGHGYPAYDQTVCEYISFENEASLKTWILQNEKASFVVLDAHQLSVERYVTISLKENQ